MTWRLETLMAVGAGVPVASTVCGATSLRRPVERRAAVNPQRVRALGRATRNARRLALRKAAQTGESSGRLSAHAGRRPAETLLPLGSGGPALLTEDRQKPCRRHCGAW